MRTSITNLMAVAGLAALLAATGCKKPATVAAASDGGAAAPVDTTAPADVAAPPDDAQKTPTGLRFKILKEGGGGERPEDQDRVSVHYIGWTTDGKMFDTSYRGANRPRPFGVNQVIPGWTEGLKLMTQGAKYRFWIPVELAYNNQPGKPAGMLVFDVELVSITKGPKPEPAPADVAAPPADALKTKSGIAYKILKPGTGKEMPEPQDKVQVNFTGWAAADGKMIETTKQRGRPATLGVDQKIPGFEEVLQLMVTGEQRRVWIPADKAFVGQAGKPAGMVVYDIELIGITRGPKPIPAPADVTAPPKDAEKTATGLESKVIKKGTGKEHPSAEATVEVHYTGWLTTGKMFDSSVARKVPARFPLKNVIPGWTEGLQLMTVGETRRFWIPVELAYNNRPGKPAGMLVFDVELLSFIEPPRAPDDVKAPPTEGVEKTASGLVSKVLKKGTGTERPTAASTVEVHYTGWTAADGVMFDSSVVRGKPAKFPLGNVIPGWTEGLQLMTVGEQRRFWIPVELAYKNAPGKPKGMLVFDVELISIAK